MANGKDPERRNGILIPSTCLVFGTPCSTFFFFLFAPILDLMLCVQLRYHCIPSQSTSARVWARR